MGEHMLSSGRRRKEGGARRTNERALLSLWNNWELLIYVPRFEFYADFSLCPAWINMLLVFLGHILWYHWFYRVPVKGEARVCVVLHIGLHRFANRWLLCESEAKETYVCTAIYKFPCFSFISYDIMGFTWLPKGLEVLVRSVSLKCFAKGKNIQTCI